MGLGGFGPFLSNLLFPQLLDISFSYKSDSIFFLNPLIFSLPLHSSFQTVGVGALEMLQVLNYNFSLNWF